MKNQSAMEFLMTYGWSIIILAVVIVVLFLFTSLPPTLTPTSCLFSVGAYCQDIVVGANQMGSSASGALILLTNAQQYMIVNPQIQMNVSGMVSNTFSCTPANVLPGGVIVCQVTLSQTLSTGSAVNGKLYLSAITCQSGNAITCASSGLRQNYRANFNTQVLPTVSNSIVTAITLTVQNANAVANGAGDLVTATVTLGGVPTAGVAVTFSTSNSLATVNPIIVDTDANGNAQTYLSSTAVGSVTVTASFSGFATSSTVNFVVSPYQRYYLTTVAGAGGSVSPSNSVYLIGTNVAITATPSSGNAFVSWNGVGTGSYSGSSASANVVMNGNIVETASFTQSSVVYSLTMNAGSGGTVSPSSGNYLVGNTVAITATPSSGNTFVSWNGVGTGSYSGSSASANVVMNGNIIETASFTQSILYSLTMNAGSGGTVSPASGNYLSGNTVTITATPSTGNYFISWTGSGSGSYNGLTNPVNVVMNGNIVETASFGSSVGVYQDDEVWWAYSPGKLTSSTITATFTSIPYSDDLDVFSLTGANSISPFDPNPSLPANVMQNTVPQNPTNSLVEKGSIGTNQIMIQFVSNSVNAIITDPNAAFPEPKISTTTANDFVFVLYGEPTNWFTDSASTTTPAAMSMLTTLQNGAAYNGHYYYQYLLGDYETVTSTQSNAAVGWNQLQPSTAGFVAVGDAIQASPGNTVAGDQQASNYGGSSLTLSTTASTTGTNELVVALVTITEPSTTNTLALVNSISGGGLTWYPRSRVLGTANTPIYSLTMNAGSGGTVSPASGNYLSGSAVTITATPSTGNYFSSWTGSGPGNYIGTSNPASVTMNGNIVETASFQAASTWNSPTLFITTWNTMITGTGQSPANEIVLPVTGGNVLVNWGDNTISSAYFHLYTNPGTYTVKIQNNGMTGFCFGCNGDNLKITNIAQWGNVILGNSGYYFYNCPNLADSATDSPSLVGTNTLGWMFYGDSVFNGNLANWNTNGIINMTYMFAIASAFNQPIGGWNTMSVTNLAHMFDEDSAFNANIAAWNTNSVKNMSGTFANSNFNQPIGSWNTMSVTNLANLFLDDPVFNANIAAWNTQSVTNMGYMFGGAAAFNQPIGGWNTMSVNNMYAVFAATCTFDQPLANWNTNSVVNMSYMFNSACGFNQPIGNWNTQKVTTMAYMFGGGMPFNQNIGSWNTMSVTNAMNMFQGDTLSITNYDALLNGWAGESEKHSVVFGAGSSQYDNSGATARNTLKNTYGWTITDGGHS